MAEISRRNVLIGSASAALVAACAPDSAENSSSDAPEDGQSADAAASASQFTLSAKQAPETGAIAEGPAGALALSQALLESASVVAVAASEADVAAAAQEAESLGIPLLVAGDGLNEELARLGTSTVVAFPSPDQVSLDGVEVIDAAAAKELEGLPLSPASANVAVLTAPDKDIDPALQPLLAAVGVTAQQAKDLDPRASADSIAQVKDAGAVVGIGDFGEHFADRVKTAQTAQELPGGGLAPFPGRFLVALYGHPGAPVLGVLGEQDPEASVARLKEYIDGYQPLMDKPVVGSFEIITTVASANAEKDNTRSTKSDPSHILPYIEAAEANNIYCLLDLQPGYQTFLEQAKIYEELLKRPWVGLALDPEWRITPPQVHMVQIGSVGIDEVNEVGAWLDNLVRENNLPPKVLVLHQFLNSMIEGRERLDTSFDSIQWLLHVDGFGAPGAKLGTWNEMLKDLPEGMFLGWKNFIDEDQPMLSPKETIDQVEPTPDLVTYQ